MLPILDIPSYIHGNLVVEKELLAWFKNRDSIAFVGAGASADLYGTWNRLIYFLADSAVERGLASGEEREFWVTNISSRPQQITKAIRKKLGDNRIFEDILRDYFKPKIHPTTKKPFTPLHEKIARLPFKGIVTTNYDCGLQEAMRTCQPDMPLNYGTWTEREIVNSWYNNDIFKDGSCPLLYAHGMHERPGTIILDTDKYREAYKFEPFTEMYKNLWATQHLAIIGVGFTDSWMDRTLDDILTHLVYGVGTRHIAIVGLRDGEVKHANSIRLMIQSAYNAKVYFYRVKTKDVDGLITEDHGELLEFLEKMYNEWLLFKK